MNSKKLKTMAITVLILSFFSISGYCDLKIGFVDSQAVADAHPGYKAKLKIIEDILAPEKAKLQDKGKELDALRKDLASDPLMSDLVKKKKEKIVSEKAKELNDMWKNFQVKLKTKEQELLPEAEQKQILKSVMEAIEYVSKKEGFQVVYELSKGNIVYIEPSLDITERVKTRLIETTSKDTNMTPKDSSE